MNQVMQSKCKYKVKNIYSGSISSIHGSGGKTWIAQANLSTFLLHVYLKCMNIVCICICPDLLNALVLGLHVKTRGLGDPKEEKWEGDWGAG